MRKIPTLFVRAFDSRPAYVTDQVTPGCEWVLTGAGSATRKYDGTCVRLDLDGDWQARREVKDGKPKPEGFIASMFDATTGKTVGWQPIEQSGFARWLREALADPNGVVDYPTCRPEPGATYELIGPKVNGNPEGVPGHLLVRHGYMDAVDLEAVAGLWRTFDGIREWLSEHDWEGLVFHHADGRMAKIKRKDFPQ